MEKKKIILLSIAILMLILGVLGVAYAYFSYSKEGSSNNQLVTGDIWMHYLEGQEVTLSDSYPSATKPSKYFEFTVDGKNTNTTKDVIYDINIMHGEAQGTTRIADKNLRFTLEEKKDSGAWTTVIDNLGYSDFSSGKRIWVDTISKNTTEKTTHTYRLYMWIGEGLTVSDTDEADYTTSEWNGIYATVKIKVTGDFTEKDLGDNDIIKYIKSKNIEIKDDVVDEEIKFYNISSATNGEGLYFRHDVVGDYPVYYFRGSQNVANNVLYANYCWKIVRTTETGGTKLVYNGEPTVADGKATCPNTTGASTQLSATSQFHPTYQTPASVGYNRSTTRYTYVEATPASGAIFGTGVDPVTKKLTNQSTTLDANHHYTYNSTNPDATTVENTTNKVRYYFYHINDNGTQKYRYFEIPNTPDEPITAAITAMVNDDTNTNTDDNMSTIRKTIETWYSSNIEGKYSSYLEDTKWCNDRSIKSWGAFDPNGGALENSAGWPKYALVFNGYMKYRSEFASDARNIANTNKPELSCSSPNDIYSVANGKINYPVALLTMDEVAMAGMKDYTAPNTNNYLYTNSHYWLLSPALFGSNTGNSTAGLGLVNASGYIHDYWSYASLGVRPSVSLKLGTTIKSGTGTGSDHFVITDYTE